MENFLDVLQTIRGDLPVFTGEVGDVWLQGIASDPLKMAKFRVFNRERTECIKSGECE